MTISNINDRYIFEIAVLLSGTAKIRCMLNEETLSSNQINSIFSDIEQKMSNEKTVTGKVAGAVGTGIKTVNDAVNKLGTLAQNTKPVQNFDNKAADIINRVRTKLQSTNPKAIKTVEQYVQWANKHPVYQGLIIGALTAIASVATGPAGGAIVGQILRTTNELMKGNKLSTAIGKGVKTGTLAFLVGMGFKEIVSTLHGLNLTGNPLAGYTNVTHMTLINHSTAAGFHNVDFFAPQDVAQNIETDWHQAEEMVRQGNIQGGLEKFNQIKQLVGSDDFQNKVGTILGNNQELMSKAMAGIKTFNDSLNNIVAALQGVTTGKSSSTQDISEMAVKNVLGGIHKWAKNKSNNITQKFSNQKLSAAWVAAGSPTDSNALFAVLTKMGIPSEVVTTTFKTQNIEIPNSDNLDQENQTVSINTPDDNLNTSINSIIKSQGKEAAIKYLQDLKTKKTQQASSNPNGEQMKEPTAQPNVGINDDESAANINKIKNRQPFTLGNKTWNPKDPNYNAIAKAFMAGTNPNTTQQSTSEQTVDKPIVYQGKTFNPDDPNYKGMKSFINSRIREYQEFDGDLWDLLETATGGATASGSIASVANPMGSVISRTPNLFGYVPYETPPKTKKRRNRRKSAA